MNKISKVMMGVMVGVVLLAASFGTVAAAGGPPTDRGMGSGAYGTGLVVDGDLTDAQVEALTEFWLDEYKALRTYEAIMTDFGAEQPFVSIANAEEMHIASLERAFERYDVEIPSVPGAMDVNFATLEDACAAAAQAEVDNAGLYAELEAVFTQDDLLRVFQQLSNASLQNHLPAFEACAEGEYVPAEDGDMLQQRLGGANDAGTRGSGNSQRGTQGAYGDMLGSEDCTGEPNAQWNGRSR